MIDQEGRENNNSQDPNENRQLFRDLEQHLRRSEHPEPPDDCAPPDGFSAAALDREMAPTRGGLNPEAYPTTRHRVELAMILCRQAAILSDAANACRGTRMEPENLAHTTSFFETVDRLEPVIQGIRDEYTQALWADWDERSQVPQEPGRDGDQRPEDDFWGDLHQSDRRMETGKLGEILGTLEEKLESLRERESESLRERPEMPEQPEVQERLMRNARQIRNAQACITLCRHIRSSQNQHLSQSGSTEDGTDAEVQRDLFYDLACSAEIHWLMLDPGELDEAFTGYATQARAATEEIHRMRDSMTRRFNAGLRIRLGCQGRRQIGPLDVPKACFGRLKRG